jgi:hypothetical protein
VSAQSAAFGEKGKPMPSRGWEPAWWNRTHEPEGRTVVAEVGKPCGRLLRRDDAERRPACAGGHGVGRGAHADARSVGNGSLGHS